MATLWNKDEVDFVIKNLELSTWEIVNKYSELFSTPRTYNSIQKKVQELRQTEPLQDESSVLITDTPYSLVQSYINQWLLEVSNNFAPREIKFLGVDNGKLSLVLSLSDLHFGQKTPIFNLDIAKQRISAIPELLLDNKIRQELDEILVVLGGDINEGEDIYANQNISLECPVIQQVQISVASLWDLLVNLQKAFKLPIRVKPVPGNHGRMSKTADPRSNWDNVTYMMLSLLAENHKDIYFDLNFEEFLTIDIKDKIGLVNHEGVKHLGTPAMQTKFAGWLFPDKLDFLMHGHYHKWEISTHLGKPMIANGCLMGGGNNLSQRMALAAEPARQAYFLIEKGKPVNHFSFLQW